MMRQLLEDTALDIAMSDMENIGTEYDPVAEAMQASDDDLIAFICEFVYEILN